MLVDQQHSSDLAPKKMTWQSNIDLPTRRAMMQKLMYVIQNKHVLTLDQSDSNDAWMIKLPYIVRRIELALYVRAASVGEYLNVRTLHRRVQFLIVSLHHQVVQRSGKRKRCVSEDSAIVEDGKRRIRLHRLLHPKIEIARVQTVSRASKFFFNNHTDVVRHIFGYLDGKEVIRNCCLNRFARDFLPSCVRNLTVSLEVMGDILLECPEQPSRFKKFDCLEELAITRDGTLDETPRVGLNYPFHAPSYGEPIIRDLAIALRFGSHPRLKSLRLNASFVNTVHVNGAGTLLTALANGCCRDLQILALGRVCLGDSGAAEVARFLLSNKCRELKHLDLRGNYIGEKGFESLAMALESGPVKKVQVLCLGCNLANDSAMDSICRALSSRRLSELKFLGLEDNFIEENGIVQLAKVLKDSVCPELRELCIGDNSIENGDIHQLFCQIMQ